MDERPAETKAAPAAGMGRTTARLVLGWVITVLGVLVTLGTIGGSLYVIFSAETTKQFAALLVSAFFFAAFPALMGLGLVIWGRKMVLRSRPGNKGR